LVNFYVFIKGKLWPGIVDYKKIIESHNGKITVESTGKGKGTSFVITMPLNSAFSKPDEKRTAIAPPSLKNF
jgi:hypothetical protein